MKLRLLNPKFILHLATISFVLLILVQTIWLSNTFRLREKEFDERLTSTLRFFNNDIQNNKEVSKHLKALLQNQTTISAVEPLLRFTVDTCFQRNNLPTDYVMGMGLSKKNMLFWADYPEHAKGINASTFLVNALCMADKGSYQLKFFFPDKKLHILSSLMPLLLFSGVSFLVLFLSFTALVYLLKKQAGLTIQKNDFINNMTHELKTPLFTVSIASRILANESRQHVPKHGKYIEVIQQEVKRLNNLVEKILQTSLLDQKKIQLEKKPMDLHLAIVRVVKGFELIQAESGGEIELRLNAPLKHIVADETHIINSIYNLIDNAFKYSTQEPKIIISTANLGNSISLQVRDNGIGFNIETKKLLFERFFRAHTGDLHDVKGYGIGLSYVKTIIEAHDGTISVDSRISKGSEFTLHLPLINNEKSYTFY